MELDTEKILRILICYFRKLKSNGIEYAPLRFDENEILEILNVPYQDIDRNNRDFFGIRAYKTSGGNRAQTPNQQKRENFENFLEALISKVKFRIYQEIHELLKFVKNPSCFFNLIFLKKRIKGYYKTLYPEAKILNRNQNQNLGLSDRYSEEIEERKLNNRHSLEILMTRSDPQFVRVQTTFQYASLPPTHQQVNKFETCNYCGYLKLLPTHQLDCGCYFHKNCLEKHILDFSDQYVSGSKLDLVTRIACLNKDKHFTKKSIEKAVNPGLKELVLEKNFIKLITYHFNSKLKEKFQCKKCNQLHPRFDDSKMPLICSKNTCSVCNNKCAVCGKSHTLHCKGYEEWLKHE